MALGIAKVMKIMFCLHSLQSLLIDNSKMSLSSGSEKLIIFYLIGHSISPTWRNGTYAITPYLREIRMQRMQRVKEFWGGWVVAPAILTP